MADNVECTCVAGCTDECEKCIIPHESPADARLSKRLSYILRYGAEKEGFSVTSEGFVALSDIVEVPMLQWYSAEAILQEVDTSLSFRNFKRFEQKTINGGVYVRALYGRRMQRNPRHDGTNIYRLVECCIDHVSDNIKQYDLTNFPDEYLLNKILHKLRDKKRLNRSAFESILGPTMENIDLAGVYLTQGIVNLLVKRCPHVKVLSLRNCGYVVTDHIVDILAKKLPELSNLNVSHCEHVTDKGLRAITKHCSNMEILILHSVPQLSQSAILNLVSTSKKLHHLDIYDNPNISDEGMTELCEYAREKNITIVLKNLTDTTVAPENPCSYSLGFGKSII